MSPKFSGRCDCGRKIEQEPRAEFADNNHGLSVRCKKCRGTVFLRAEGTGRRDYLSCPWFIPRETAEDALA